MRVRALSLGLVLSLSLLLVACGGGGTASPVMAQATAFSLNGKYLFSDSGAVVSGGVLQDIFDDLGTLTADGNGRITSGSDVETDVAFGRCQQSLTGNYTVSSTDGTGTVTLTSTPLPGQACSSAGPSTTTLNVIVNQGGTAVVFVSASSTNFFSGTAVKQ